MVITHDFTLDFSRADIQVQLNGFRTGDKDVHQLNPTYKNAGVPWAPDDGAHFRFFASLPSGAMVYMDFGETLVLPSSVLAEVGVVSATVEIAKGDQVLYAPMFSLNVQAGDSGADHIEASDDFSALISATRDANVAKQACVDEVAKVEQMLEDGEFDGPPGPQGPPGEVTPGSITTDKIADYAVTQFKLANGSVTAAKLADNIGLPSGYTRMRYLQSLGSQFINTGVYPKFVYTDGALSEFTGVTITATQAAGDNSDVYVRYWLGCSADAIDDMRPNDPVSGLVFYRDWDYRTGRTGTACRINDQTVLLSTNNLGGTDSLFGNPDYPTDPQCMHNGEITGNVVGVTAFESDMQIALFGCTIGSAGEVWPSEPILVQGCRISTFVNNFSGWSEMPLRDFVPALDPYGAPCMFDRVTQTPFYNAGDDQFLFG